MYLHIFPFICAVRAVDIYRTVVRLREGRVEKVYTPHAINVLTLLCTIPKFTKLNNKSLVKRNNFKKKKTLP